MRGRERKMARLFTSSQVNELGTETKSVFARPRRPKQSRDFVPPVFANHLLEMKQSSPVARKPQDQNPGLPRVRRLTLAETDGERSPSLRGLGGRSNPGSGFSSLTLDRHGFPKTEILAETIQDWTATGSQTHPRRDGRGAKSVFAKAYSPVTIQRSPPVFARPRRPKQSRTRSFDILRFSLYALHCRIWTMHSDWK